MMTWKMPVLGALIFLISGLTNSESSALPLPDIEKRGYVIVGVNPHQRPLTFRDNTGELQGLEIEIIKRLVAEMRGGALGVQFVELSNEGRLQGVIDDKVDLAIAGVTITPSRLRVVNFSLPYYLAHTAIITHQNHGTLKDNDSLAVIQGSRAIPHLRYHLPNNRLVGVASYQEGLQLLQQKKVQGFAGDNTILTGWLKENPPYRLLDSNYGVYPLAIVMPKGLKYQSLRDEVNRIIRQLEDEKWLENQAQKWQLIDN
ncbi:MAG: transporter substrate-binding domain-containing protein [Cyanobacterium sp. T60_A2020_053]|nr:transporter substrate-binding domain-containing protein [Cyanobacterium sp. T60_A2020_053]